jgi:hypothetical protein
MRTIGTGRGCGLVNFCGRRMSSSRKGHTPGRPFEMLGQSLPDRRADGPTFPGDEFLDDDNDCCSDDWGGGGTPKLHRRKIRVTPRLERLRRTERIVRRHRSIHGGHHLRHGQRVLGGRHHVQAPPTGRAWIWDPSSRRWHHVIRRAHDRRVVRATPNYRIHHIPPPPPPAHAAHVRHVVTAPSVHHVGHWGWSPVLHKYAWIGPHSTEGAIDPSTLPPGERAAVTHLLKQNLAHTHAQTVWGATGARELFIPGHWGWNASSKTWTYIEPHADQLGRPMNQVYPQHTAPAAAFGRRPPHIAPAEFWPDPTGRMLNQWGQHPSNASGTVTVPPHANFARQNGLLSAEHIHRVRDRVWKKVRRVRRVYAGKDTPSHPMGRAQLQHGVWHHVAAPGHSLPGRKLLPGGQFVQLANGKVIPRWSSGA